MFSANTLIKESIAEFHHDGMMRYSEFVPRLYNLCRSLGFTPGKIMPSRAFCSDENQGYPVILLAKHFGTFPFNHGIAGGIVATDRHGPHSHHGKDLVIIHASHVCSGTIATPSPASAPRFMASLLLAIIHIAGSTPCCMKN